VLTGLLSLALAAPASADDQTQPYVLTTSPSLTSAGQSVTVTATLSLPSPVGDRERDGDDQDDQLGSANLFLPMSVFSGVTAATSSQGTATLGTCTLGTLTGPCIQLRTLALKPGNTLVVTITASTPACSTATGTWSVEAKPSNDFHDPTGDDLDLSSSSQLTSTLDGACPPAPHNPQPYTLTVSPNLTSAGQRVTVTATLGLPSAVADHDLAGRDDPLGSANVFLPTSVFSGVTAATSSQGTATLGTCTFGTVTGPCIQLRNLGLKPGNTVAVTFTASTPACSTATGAWLVEAKPSNDFHDPTGDDLNLSSGSQPTSTLDGACSLTWNAQPAKSRTFDAVTAPFSFVTSVPLTPGSPLRVAVLDSQGKPAKGSIDAQFDGPTVTLTARPNPGGATLGGTGATASGGIASFGAVTINRAGDGYVLSASSGSLAPRVSRAFNVVNKAVSCRVKVRACSTMVGNDDGRGRILAKATKKAGTGELTLSVNSGNSNTLQCGRYVSADQNVYEFRGPPGRSKVGTITITRPDPVSPTLKGSRKRILRAQQICFDGPVRFIAARGVRAAPDGYGGFIGLLPTCVSDVPDRDNHDRNDGDHDGDDRRVTTGPCQDRSKDATPPDPSSPLGFDIVLVADIPAEPGDPHMR
jgi:hypothetical protein